MVYKCYPREVYIFLIPVYRQNIVAVFIIDIVKNCFCVFYN